MVEETKEGFTPKQARNRKLGIGCAAVLGVLFLLPVIFPESDEDRAAREQRESEEAAQELRAERAERDEAAAAAVAGATAVTATELFEAYSANEVAAQARYGDRALLVTGTIDSVTLDFMDQPVVALKTSNQFMSAQMDFDEGDVEAVSQLRSGQQVTALCTEVSEIAGTPMLDGCTLQPAQ